MIAITVTAITTVMVLSFSCSAIFKSSFDCCNNKNPKRGQLELHVEVSIVFGRRDIFYTQFCFVSKHYFKTCFKSDCPVK